MKRLTFVAKAIIMLSAVLAGIVAVAAPTSQWSQGNPTADEQYALEVINRVRLDPQAAMALYGTQSAQPGAPTVLVNTYNAVNLSYLPAKTMLQTDTQSYLAGHTGESFPKAPYALYPLFTEQAASQGRSMLAGGMDSVLLNGFNSIESTAYYDSTAGGKLTVPRVNYFLGTLKYPDTSPSLTGSNATGGTAVIKAGSPAGSASEFVRDQLLGAFNFYDTTVSMREAFISDISSSGFWMTMLFEDSWTHGVFGANTGKTRMIGIKFSDTRSAAPGAGGRSLFLFATDNEAFSSSDLPFGADTRFITGVVYQDNDKNGDYTQGEGISGVTITPSTGNYYAVTSLSGGYSIPINKNSGTVSLTISRPGTDFSTATILVNLASVGSGATTSINVGAENVKLDFVLPINKPAQVTIVGSDPNPPAVVNLSTRGVAEPGQNALIGGFVINGPTTFNGQPTKKRVLIRAVGYTMRVLGIRAFLPKPMLQLFANGSSTAMATATTENSYVTNPAFKPQFVESTSNSPVMVAPTLSQAMTSVGAFAFNVPLLPGELITPVTKGLPYYGDAAMVVDLAPGGYTAMVTPDPKTPSDVISWSTTGSGIYGTAQSGVVLLEIYDLSKTDGATLVNLSSRGYMSNTLPSTYPGDKSLLGERQMIVGFVLAGGDTNAQRRVLLRGISPSLQILNIDPSALMDDPLLTTYNADGTVQEVVDDWGNSSHADQLSTLMPNVGAFPMSATSKDAATVLRFGAGRHTAGVTANFGKATGIVLVELYTTD